MRLKEESLTDFNLLEIQTRHPIQVITQAYDTLEEGSGGADWEWWLTGSSGLWLGFRVQAKIIDVNAQRFNKLHYWSDTRAQFQSQILCDYAVNSNPQTIPLYCLYSYWSNAPRLPFPFPFPSSLVSPEFYGCSIVDGFFVRDTRRIRNSRSLRFLFGRMIPWHFLVCNIEPSSRDLPAGALQVWRELIQRPFERTDQAHVPNFELVSEPPAYVQALLDKNGPKLAKLPISPDSRLGRVTVFQERDSNVKGAKKGAG